MAGASFCEACGAELHAEPAPAAGAPCVSCGAGAEHQGDGYCLRCGHKQPTARDHMEQAVGRVAGVTDRGRRHHRNEDAMAFADDGDHLLVVVCDGVSTTEIADQASQAASDAALLVLQRWVREERDVEEAMAAATAAAQAAVLGLAGGGGSGASPSCTFVATAVAPVAEQASQVTVGWLGDSRAYWLGASPRQLTRDHTLAAELVAAGELDEEQALRHPRGRSITRWIGADAQHPEPEVMTAVIGDRGRILVCTDGLWSHVPDLAQLLARPELSEPDLAAQAAGLVAFANEAGGHDNITVVIGSLDAVPGAGSAGPGPT